MREPNEQPKAANSPFLRSTAGFREEQQLLVFATGGQDCRERSGTRVGGSAGVMSGVISGRVTGFRLVSPSCNIDASLREPFWSLDYLDDETSDDSYTFSVSRPHEPVEVDTFDIIREARRKETIEQVSRAAASHGFITSDYDVDDAWHVFTNDSDHSIGRLDIRVYWDTLTAITRLPSLKGVKNEPHFIVRQCTQPHELNGVFADRALTPFPSDCPVCLEHTVEKYPLTCGHEDLCTGCAGELRQPGGLVRCPLCRFESHRRSTEFSRFSNSPEDDIRAEIVRAEKRLTDGRDQVEQLKKQLETCAQRHAKEVATVREQEERARIERAAKVCRQQEEEQRKQRLQQEQLERQCQIRIEEERTRQQVLQEERARQAAAEALEKRRVETERKRLRERGTLLHCAVAGVSRRMAYAFQNSSRTISSLSVGGNAVVSIDDEGGQMWTSGLPTDVYNKLNSRNPRLPKPELCALGHFGEYVLKFKDGKIYWKGSHLDDLVNGESSSDPFVSLSIGNQCAIAVYRSGRINWTGAIPSRLGSPIESRGRRMDYKFASLGPNGQYFLRTKNNNRWWGGMDEEDRNHISNFSDVRSVFFGTDGSLVVRYNHFD